MFNVGNDIDEMLRRAAEGFPLKEGADRWNEISFQLSATNSPAHQKKTFKPLYSFICCSVLCLLCMNFETVDLTKAMSYAYNTNSDARMPIEIPENVETKMVDRKVNVFSDNVSSLKIWKGNKFLNHQNSEKTLVAGESSQNDVSIPIVSFSIVEDVSVPSLDSPVVMADAFTSNRTEQAETATENKKIKKWYAGLTGGINYSTVKNAGTPSLGISAGVIAGFRFSKNWEIETGLLLNKETYYGKGKDFDIKEMRSAMSPGMEIMELSGLNYTLELPLQLKYYFIAKQPIRFFATAGTSSFLMLKEMNDYQVSNNGLQETMKGSYHKNRFYPAGTLNFSLGIEKNLRKSSIRLEPYLQLPLQGIGIGSMPITSFGLRFAVFR